MKFKINRLKKNIKNYFSSIKKAKKPIGQLTNETESGQIISNFIQNYKLKNILEIGTWNGLGSTLTIINALNKVSENYNFISIESDKIFYKQALKNLKNYLGDNVSLRLGRLFELDELPNVDELDLELFGLHKNNYEWFVQDLRRYKKIKNIYPTIPTNFDFILFDGGEFSTYPEFIKLFYKTQFFALDDTDKYKQFEVLNYINLNKDQFKLCIEIPGFAIYEYLNF